ncbi:MAG: hypothetical protein CMH12_06835 [Maritimibacter sp.]|nr:hypothetical protein [Maritimibacter sp.]
MSRMTPWTVALLAGIAIVAIYPIVPADAVGLGSGVFPEYLIPIGYFLSGLGAAGLVLAWVRKRGVKLN